MICLQYLHHRHVYKSANYNFSLIIESILIEQFKKVALNSCKPWPVCVWVEISAVIVLNGYLIPIK